MYFMFGGYDQKVNKKVEILIVTNYVFNIYVFMNNKCNNNLTIIIFNIIIIFIVVIYQKRAVQR